MPIRKSELTPEEVHTLERLYRGGPYLNLDYDAVTKLMELGLAKQLLGGPGISEPGRRLLFTGST